MGIFLEFVREITRLWPKQNEDLDDFESRGKEDAWSPFVELIKVTMC